MVVIVDGDVIAYASCPPRRNIVDAFSVVSLDMDGHVIPEEHTVDEDAEYKRQCWNLFERNLEELASKFFSDTLLCAVKSPTNFRDEIYCDYKLNRRGNAYGQEKLPFVRHLRNMAVFTDWAIEATGCEADDYLRIWANQCTAQGLEYVIVSIDKDLLCIPGKHYRLRTKNRNGMEGELIEVSQEEAIRHYYEQLIKGDMTDNIPGVLGIGPKIAAAMLKDCKTEEEMQEKTVSAYIGAYGDDWLSYLLSNGKMIHIQNHPDDYFRCRHWPICKELLE
jgi:DNA polymerase-1